MYILDKDSNQLINAKPTTFKEQKLKECQHLQERPRSSERSSRQ